jgi:hypothetical protein
MPGMSVNRYPDFARRPNHHTYADEKRDALERWGAFVMSLTQPPRPDLRLVS